MAKYHPKAVDLETVKRLLKSPSAQNLTMPRFLASEFACIDSDRARRNPAPWSNPSLALPHWSLCAPLTARSARGAGLWD